MLLLLVAFVCTGGMGRSVIRGEFLGEGSADVALTRGALTTAGEWQISLSMVGSSSVSDPVSDSLDSDGSMSYSCTSGFGSPRYGENARLSYNSPCHRPSCRTT